MKQLERIKKLETTVKELEATVNQLIISNSKLIEAVTALQKKFQSEKEINAFLRII